MAAQFDRLSEAPTLDGLPIRMQQSNSLASTLTRLALLSPALVLLAVPMLAAAQVAVAPGALSTVSDNAMAVLQVVVGFLLWAGLMAVPLTQAVGRLRARRRVEIDRDEVRVMETRLTGTHSWSVPVASYRGIAHHVRTSISGVRHELILVHPDPARHVLLTTKDRLSQVTLDKAKALLGLPEVPARSLYERGAAGLPGGMPHALAGARG